MCKKSRTFATDFVCEVKCAQNSVISILENTNNNMAKKSDIVKDSFHPWQASDP